MSAGTIMGVPVTILDQPRMRLRHARKDTRRIHTGHNVRDAGFRDLWDVVGTVGPFTSTTRRKWVLFLEGVGETWMFEDGQTYGSRGSTPNAGGTYTISGTSGKFNGRTAVSSGSFMEVPSDITTADGWTIRVWRKQAAGSWEHYVVFGTGTDLTSANVEASVDGATKVQASTLGVNNWLAVASDGDVRVKGVDTAGVNAAVDYSELEIRPFGVTDAMAEGMSGVTVESYALPEYKMSGDAIGTEHTGSARYMRVDIKAQEEEVMMIGGDLNGMVSFVAMEGR